MSGEIETVARKIAAQKMHLVKDTEGANLPDELWQQCLPDARVALGLQDEPETRFVTCPECDGLGEWDEGPIYRRWEEPDYRQVKCPMCGGTGTAEVEVRPINEADIPS